MSWLYSLLFDLFWGFLRNFLIYFHPHRRHKKKEKERKKTKIVNPSWDPKDEPRNVLLCLELKWHQKVPQFSLAVKCRRFYRFYDVAYFLDNRRKKDLFISNTFFLWLPRHNRIAWLTDNLARVCFDVGIFTFASYK